MISVKPTDQQLEDAREVILWIVENTEKNEPWASGLIESGKAFADEMPIESCDIEV